MLVADRPPSPAAIRIDLGAIFVSMELSKSTWLVTSLSPGGGERMSKQVEQVALEALHRRKPDRVLETNVEFYTALLLEAAGFPKHVFTGVFAMGRVAGWLAHAREQALTGRLIRPASRYVEPLTKDAA